MKFRQSKRVIGESKKDLKESFMDEYVPATVATVNDNLSVEEYFGTLMQSVVETWGLHLNTNKYSEHIALNELYDNLLESVDALIENYKGIYGNIPAKAEVFKPEATNASEYLIELREFVEKGRSLFVDSEILSDIDSILSAIDECMYKVENLTENRKRNRKMMKESKELRLIKLFRTNNRNIKVIGYFGEATWEETKNFVERINGAWRLPTIDEGKEILYQFGKKNGKLAIADMFSKGIWVDSNSEKGYCVFADGGEGYRKNSNIFLIR